MPPEPYPSWQRPTPWGTPLRSGGVRTREFGSFRHLALRFLGALSPAGPVPADEAWARSLLLPGELALWQRMSGPDRRHAVGVARDTIARLSGDGVPATRPVAAAALLHDVGKVEAGLGTLARVAVTLAAMVVGRERMVSAGSGAPVRSWRRRAAAYLTHDRIGERLLRHAGADELTVTWAAEHHLAPQGWTVARSVAEALKAADGD